MTEEKGSPISIEDVDEKDIPEKIPTKYINNRVIVFNPLYASYLYVRQKFFGSPLGISKPRLEYFSKPSELSLIEALYLLKNDKITKYFKLLPQTAHIHIGIQKMYTIKFHSIIQESLFHPK